MSKEPLEYIKHIRDECFFIITVINNKIIYEDFVKDETLKRAVVRSLEIIGEAKKKIPGDLNDQ